MGVGKGAVWTTRSAQRECCDLGVKPPPSHWGRYQQRGAASLPRSIACTVRTQDYAEGSDVSMVYVGR